MRAISFFFNKWGAGEIDGQQIGEFIGAKLNSIDDYQDDVCIYVKCQPPENYPEKSYVNVVDGVRLVSWLQRHPRVGAIVTSLTAQEFLTKKLDREVIFIPEHHCNYERFQRDRKEITIVGMIGNLKGFAVDLGYAKERFEKMGLDFKWKSTYENRFDIVGFYRGIDIQVNWRPHVKGAHAKLHNPLKLANAASFGIPTVSYPEENYMKEFEGYFLPANTIDEMFDNVKMLKDDPERYRFHSNIIQLKAEEYHIENIARIYEELK